MIGRTYDSPLGELRLGATERGVRLVEFPSRAPTDLAEGSSPLLHQLVAELDAYFARTLRVFTVPLDLEGTLFQREVWDELLKIPYGQTTTYGAIARGLGNPGGSRAVGLANGANHVAILVPCHRVVAADGTLHGYGGGLANKRWLLDHERGQGGLPLG